MAQTPTRPPLSTNPLIPRRASSCPPTSSPSRQLEMSEVPPPPPHEWILISCSSKGPHAPSLLPVGTCFTSSLRNCSVSGDLLWGEATTAGLRHCIGLSLLAGGVWEQLGVPGKGRAPGLCGAVGGACLPCDPGKSCHLIFQTVRGTGGQEDLQVTPTSKGLHVTFCPPFFLSRSLVITVCACVSCVCVYLPKFTCVCVCTCVCMRVHVYKCT